MNPSPRAASRVLYVAEPSGAWTRHPPAVVDCSVIAALLWAEPAAGEARSRIHRRTLHAPALLGYELANVARNKCRSGVPAPVARAGLELFAQMDIDLHDVDAALMFDLAQQLNLTPYDAAYLALAIEHRAPLLTFDQKLAETAQRVLGAAE